MERIELELFATNTNSVSLYKKMEFVVEGARRGAVRVGGDAVDLVLRARSLAAPRATHGA